MALQFREPFQINPYRPSQTKQGLSSLNQTLQNLSQQAIQQRQQEFNRKIMQAQEGRAQGEYDRENTGMMSPSAGGASDYSPEGPSPTPWNPQGVSAQNGGYGEPMTPDSSNPANQPQMSMAPQQPAQGGFDPMAFHTWKQSRANPMDQYSQIMSMPGSKNRAEAMGFMKTRSELEEQQARAAKERAQADMFGKGGTASSSVTWKQNPFTGGYDPYPTKMTPGMTSSASPSVGGQGVASGSGQPSAPENGFDYKTRIKLQKEKPKASAALNGTLREYDNMINEAQAIANDPALSYSTGMASSLGGIPGSQMKRVSARLDTLKSKTLLNVLSSMKSLAANGASGFGALSEKEGEAIRSSVTTLDQKLSSGDLKASLQRFVNEMKARKSDLTNVYQDTYGEPFQGSSPDQSQGQPNYMKTATNRATGERRGQLQDGSWEKIQ